MEPPEKWRKLLKAFFRLYDSSSGNPDVFLLVNEDTKAAVVLFSTITL